MWTKHPSLTERYVVFPQYPQVIHIIHSGGKFLFTPSVNMWITAGKTDTLITGYPQKPLENSFLFELSTIIHR